MSDRRPSFRCHLASEILLTHLLQQPDISIPLLPLAEHPRDRATIEGATALQHETLARIEPHLSNEIRGAHRIGLSTRGRVLAADIANSTLNVLVASSLTRPDAELVAQLTGGPTYRPELLPLAYRGLQVLRSFAARPSWLDGGDLMRAVVRGVCRDLREPPVWTYLRASRKALLFLDLEGFVSISPFRVVEPHEPVNGWVALTDTGRKIAAGLAAAAAPNGPMLALAAGGVR